MTIHDLIQRRESIRSYDPTKPLTQTTLHKILESGRLAPSAANRQPWQFIVVSSPEMLAKVRPCYTRPWFQDAPHIVVVAGKRPAAWVRGSDGYNSIETDLTIALDHMILAAEAEDVATCWIAAFDPLVLREALNLTADDVVFALTPLGYPRPDFTRRGVKTRKAFDEVVRFV